MKPVVISSQILNDPGVEKLSDRCFRRYIECLLLAANEGIPGFLPETDKAAWRLRITEDDLIADLRQLEQQDLFQEIEYVGRITRWYTSYFERHMTERETTRYQFTRQRNASYRQLVERDGEYCQHCGETSNLSVDHVVAIANGGGNDISNLQLLCRSCNSRKGAR